MESFAHVATFLTLLSCLKWWWRDKKDFVAAGNISIFYPSISPRTGRKVQKKLSFRGPDFFVVLRAKLKPHRNSWVVENEGGKYPSVIVEILSKKTRKVDHGEKKAIYQKIFKTPEYFLFDPDTLELEGYRLVRGRYAAIKPDAHGRLWSAGLQMSFGVHDDQLRWFTLRGMLVPMPDEAALAAMERAGRAEREERRQRARADRAEQDKARAEQDKARAEQDKARAEQDKVRAEQDKARAEQDKARAEREKARLVAKLRAIGVDPEALG